MSTSYLGAADLLVANLGTPRVVDPSNRRDQARRVLLPRLGESPVCLLPG
jgi:hypothetical protein